MSTIRLTWFDFYLLVNDIAENKLGRDIVENIATLTYCSPRNPHQVVKKFIDVRRALDVAHSQWVPVYEFVTAQVKQRWCQESYRDAQEKFMRYLQSRMAIKRREEKTRKLYKIRRMV